MGFPLWLTKFLVRTRLAGFTPRGRRLTDGGTRYLRYYSDRVLGAPVEELLDPAYLPDTPGPDVIDLNGAALRSESGISLGRFTAERRGNPPYAGLLELRTAIAAREVQVNGRSVNPETEVLVTHGATGALATVFDAFVNPGDRVVLFDPCSPLFSLGAKSRRATVRWVPTWTEDGRSRYLATNFEKAMRGAKLLVLADPANPTGGCLAEEDLDHIAWIAAAYDVIVVADTSFTRFRFEPANQSLAALPGAEQRILTIGSVTQEHGLGSLRVGWMAGQRHLVRACQLVQNVNAPLVPAVCQQAASRALCEPDDRFAQETDRLQGKRDDAVDRLSSLGLELDRPGGGLFLWVPVAALGIDGRTFAERLYREEQVLVSPGCAYGPGGAGHIRISLAGDEGRFRAGLSRIASLVARLKTPNPTQVEPREDSPATIEAGVPDGEVVETTAEARPTFSRV